MKKLRPTDARQKEDFDLVLQAVKKNFCADYDDSLNPYEVGTLRFERFKRYYIRARKKTLDMEVRWRDLCEVYGMPSPPNDGVSRAETGE